MADDDVAQPLLDHEGWSEVEDLERQTRSLTVAELFREHPGNTITYLQTKGIARLGGFKAPDHLVFPAFESDPLLTLGSNTRDIDYQREWKQLLLSKGVKGAGVQEGLCGDVDVEAYVVTIRGAADPDDKGLLRPLLRRWQAGRCNQAVFSLPAVQAVLSWKWWTFCHKLLLVELAAFLLWLVAFNAWTITFQDEDLSLTLRQLLATSRGKLELICHLLALLAMSPFLLLEAGTVRAYGRGWLDLWNMLDIATYANQVCITVMHLSRWRLQSGWLSVLPAVQLILLVFRLQYFCQVFRPTRFAFLDTVRTVFNDMKWMFAYMLVVMWGFGSAFHIIFRRDQEHSQEYDTILHAVASMFEHQQGLGLKDMYTSSRPYAATSLAVVYSFVMGLVLANLLIGIVVNSLEKATEDAETKMLLSQARIIDELEATIPEWLERRMGSQWYPRYVHVLRINTDKLDQVNNDALWGLERNLEDAVKSRDGGGPNSSASQGDQEGGHSRAWESKGGQGASAYDEDADLRASVAVMRRQLEDQGQLLRELCQQLRAQGSVTAAGLG